MSFRRLSDEELDRLIKEALLERTNEDPPMDAESAYQDFKQRNKVAHKVVGRGLRKRWLIPGGVVFFLLIYIATPLSTNAFQQLAFYWQQVRGETLNIMIGQAPPSADNSLSESEEASVSLISFRELSLQEIEEVHGFPIMYPQMEGLVLTRSEAMFLREEIIEVYLSYVDESTETEIKVSQKDMEDSGFGMMLSEEDTERKELYIDGEQALYFAYDTGFKEIIWRKKGYLLTVEGELEEVNLIKIAQSIR